MRVSTAALAMITRPTAKGENEYLLLWNENWQVYSLLGGHLEEGETFRDCCHRELAEELACNPNEIQIGPYPYATLSFQEFSHAARERTDYQWEIFTARVEDAALQNLPETCIWVRWEQIRGGRAADGKPIAAQVARCLKAIEEAKFDLFVSYGHADNQDDSVTELVEHIRREHQRFAPTEPLKIFFDLWEIHSGEEWERRIYKGLIESKTMLAVLSPSYFKSPWCQREFDGFAQQQKKKLYPGESIHAIYILEHPDFDGQESHPHQKWFEELKSRQFVDAKPWWPAGQQMLQEETVAKQLDELRQAIWNQVTDVRAIERSPTNLAAFNVNFVGREKELADIWNALRMDHAVAVSTIQGVGGLGKTALARAYAHSRRKDYMGGQFEIGMENISTAEGLRLEIVQLANLYLGAGIPDEEINTNLPAAFAQAKAVFERPGVGKTLLILDNVANDGVLSDRSSSLPSPEAVHVLATTRLDPERWGIDSIRLEALNTADALDLFQKYRPFETPADETRWHRARTDAEQIPETEVDSDEWKAAVGIVNRLGGHALAIEVVAVYLGNHPSIPLPDYLQGLITKGLSVKLDQAGDDPAVRARLREAIETNLGELLKPTFEKLEQENPLAMRALEWAALLPPDHVPWVWLEELIRKDHADELQHDADDPDPWTDAIVRQLQGWRLLTSEEGEPVARMNRIVQTVVGARAAVRSNNVSSAKRLLPFLILRSEELAQHWGEPGRNWELTPLFEAAQLLLDQLGVEVGPLVDRLIQPLRLDGRLLPAIKIQQQVLDLEESRLQASWENADYARDLSVSYNKMGNLFRALGDSAQSRTYYEKDLAIAERLSRSSPENADYARDLSVSYLRMASIEEFDEKTQEALNWWQKSHDQLRSMVDRGWHVSPEDLEYLQQLKQLLDLP